MARMPYEKTLGKLDGVAGIGVDHYDDRDALRSMDYAAPASFAASDFSSQAMISAYLLAARPSVVLAEINLVPLGMLEISLRKGGAAAL